VNYFIRTLDFQEFIDLHEHLEEGTEHKPGLKQCNTRPFEVWIVFSCHSN